MIKPQVRQMVAVLDTAGFTRSDIADAFGISTESVRRIVAEKRGEAARQINLHRALMEAIEGD